MVRVFCENWSGRAKGDIILGIQQPFDDFTRKTSSACISYYGGNIALHQSLLFITLILRLFFTIRIASYFCVTSYYVFNIAYFAVMLQNRGDKTSLSEAL